MIAPADRTYDVFGMCNALFDIQAEVEHSVLDELGLASGGMFLLDPGAQQAVAAHVRSRVVNLAAGGSGANTMIGLAALGGRACYTSHVGADEFGALYAHSLAERGVKPNLGVGAGSTGTCVVLVTPDAQRTMAVSLGESQNLQPEDVDLADLADSRVLYVTGYLWDTPSQRAAVKAALGTARVSGVKVAFSLSDSFCVERHHADFAALVDGGVDVLFGNAEEVRALTGLDDAAAAARRLAATCGVVAVTMDRHGSRVLAGGQEIDVPAFAVEPVDTTGAGDAYAAGLLYGLTHGWPLALAGRAGAWLAARVVGQMGPRIGEVDVETLAAAVEA